MTKVSETIEITAKCDFFYIKNNFLGNVYECKLKERVLEGNETIKNIVGTHNGGYNNSCVKLLNFDFFKCDQIPRGFDKKFPNLLGIVAIKIGLKRLEVDHLKGFKNLKFVIFQDNSLKT